MLLAILLPWSRFTSLRSKSHPPSALPAPKTASTPPSHPPQYSQEPTAAASLNASHSQPRNTSSPHTKSLPTPPPTPSKLNVNTQMLVEEEPKHSDANGNVSLLKGLNKKLSGIRVITIAGENRGACMEINQSGKKPNHLHKKGNSKMKGYDYESEKSDSAVTSPPPSGVYMNSNVQCVNNSLLSHSSCTNNAPGVHLTLSNSPFGEGFLRN